MTVFGKEGFALFEQASPYNQLAKSGICSGLSIRVERDISELKYDWRLLESRADTGTFYQTYYWCAAWLEACQSVGQSEDVRIVTVSAGPRVVLIWPLAVRRLGPLRVLQALGDPATQFCDILVETRPDLANLIEMAWRHIVGLPGIDAVYLRHVRADSVLSRAAGVLARTTVLQKEDAPLLPLRPTASTEAGPTTNVTRSGRSINALKRHRKKLSAAGPVSAETVPRDDHVAITAEALLMKDQWLQNRGAASSGFGHPANRNAILSLARRGVFKIFCLRTGDRIAAIEIGAVWQRRYYSLIQSYDLRYAAHAPGRLLTWMLLDECKVDADQIEFLAPSQPHKTEWTSLSVPVADHVIALNRKGSLAVWYLGKGRETLKSVFYKLPAGLRLKLFRWVC